MTHVDNIPSIIENGIISCYPSYIYSFLRGSQKSKKLDYEQRTGVVDAVFVTSDPSHALAAMGCFHEYSSLRAIKLNLDISKIVTPFDNPFIYEFECVHSGNIEPQQILSIQKISEINQNKNGFF